MGWIIFVVVLLIMLSSMRSRAAKTRARMSQQVTTLQAQATEPVQSSQSYQSAQSMVSGNSPPGTAPVYQPGNSATYRPGDSPTYGPGNSPTYRPGDAQTYQPSNAPTSRSPMFGPGNSPTYPPGDAAVYAPGDSPTYAPVAAIGSRPAITSAPQQAPPPQEPKSRRDYDADYQPAYASLTEIATARRDQEMIDRDARRASRTSPEQAPYQGSTAVSSTSLNTTLAMPYQPSSLMTSLSSSLSSSLTDSSPKPETSAVFGGVAVVALPTEVAELVRFHLRNGHEVEAVRVVCDTMDVGLLEATKTIRSYS